MGSATYDFSRKPIPVPPVETKFRTIKTPIPCEGTDELICELEKYESRSMQGQIPIIWDRAEDFNVYDIAGNKWIDFTSTIFVTNCGHGNPEVIKAVKKVLDKPLLHTYAYANKERVEYLKALIEFAGNGFEKAFLLSAGTEATEAAVKLMRMHGQKTNPGKVGVICIEGNWHGRTMGAQMLSSNVQQKEWVGYTDPNIFHIPFPYPWDERSPEEIFNEGINSLKSKGIDFRKDICGVMLETFQGWGAVFYPKEYVKLMEKFCRENDILLTFDEMQSGFARTGKKFGYELYEVKADLLCVGKGMGGGFSISGVIGKTEIMDLPEIGNMSSTHSANPVVCSAAKASLDYITENNLVEKTFEKGKLFHEELNKIKEQFSEQISYVLGEGLLAAIHFKNPKNNEPDGLFASKLSELCMQKGLLVVHTGRESVKLAPPLTICTEALLEGIEVIREAMIELNED